MKGMNKKIARYVVIFSVVALFCTGFALYNGYKKDYSDDVTYQQANHLIELLNKDDLETGFEYWDIQKIEDDLFLVSYSKTPVETPVLDVYKTEHSWVVQNDDVVYEVEQGKLLKGKTLDNKIAEKFNHNIKTFSEDVKKKKIKFKTEEIESARVPKGEKQKFSVGKDGEKEFKEFKTFVNGKLKDTKKTEKTVVEVVDEVTLIGTYVAPPPPPPPKAKPDVKTVNDIHSGRKLTWYNVKFNKDGSIAPWAYKMYGGHTFTATGCVPTALAIAMSGYGVQVNPGQVGDYLYSKKMFNQPKYLGSGGKGVESAIRNYGLGVNGLKSQAAVGAALKSGNVVVAAVQSGRFGIGFGTHMIVLNGYSNGSTYVTDPTFSNKSGNESIAALWAGQSYDVVDRELGYVFFEISGGGFVEEPPVEKPPTTKPKPTPPPTEPEKPKDEFITLEELKGLSKQQADNYLSGLGIKGVYSETIVETDDAALDKQSIVQTSTKGLKHNKKDKELALTIHTYKFVEKSEPENTPESEPNQEGEE